MSETTVRRGVHELEAGEDPLPHGRARRVGGGRKNAEELDPGVVPAVLALVEPDERGDPMSPLRWTTKSLRHLADELTRQGHTACPQPTAHIGILSVVEQGVHCGAAGWIDDDLAFVKPWGFAVDQFAVPTFLWQGGQDLMVPYVPGEWLAGHVPGAVTHLMKNEGHFSVALGRTAEVLRELAKAF